MLIILLRSNKNHNKTKYLGWHGIIAYMFNLQIIIPVIHLRNTRNYFKSREEVSLYKMHCVTMHPVATSKPNLHKPQEMNARRRWKGEEKEEGGHVKAISIRRDNATPLSRFFGAKLILYACE